MEVILRPANDDFLREVVFPTFELGVIEAEPALNYLLEYLNDEHTRNLIEIMLDRGISGGFWGLDDDRWFQVCYRLLFWDWVRDGGGWSIIEPQQGFAGTWEDTLHVSLMLEHPDYPYEDPRRARGFRKQFFAEPDSGCLVASMVCGSWDPVPAFPPDQVTLQVGDRLFRPDDKVARADWCWRPTHLVNQLASRLPSALSKLLARETKRLSPVEAPERHEILEYWLGRTDEPPVLAVSFSGLGPQTGLWIREIGQFARVIRASAAAQHGLTAVVTHRGASQALFAEDD